MSAKSVCRKCWDARYIYVENGFDPCPDCNGEVIDAKRRLREIFTPNHHYNPKKPLGGDALDNSPTNDGFGNYNIE